MKSISLLLLSFIWSVMLIGQDSLPTIEDKTQNMQAYPGYFPFYWEANSGKIWLEIGTFETEFLYVNSLAAGLGSNDIGLDRGQLGQERVVFFRRTGPKVLLIQPNYQYRAVSENPDEQRSVAEAFAQSVIGGFMIGAESQGKVLVDMTAFLLRDAHHVVQRLAESKQGKYSLDLNRSAIHLAQTKNFPQNSEWEAMLTFQGKPESWEVPSVTPSPDAISLRQHHSFIELPELGSYQPRAYDPGSGFIFNSYQDYATPIDQSLVKRYIIRHKLERRNPNAPSSPAVEPIVYYVDRGAPEPIRSALIEGASWWNQAFEAAGYENAFQVKVMPEDADPMDVRYNLIQWVHRSTRGWSYGGSVTDPRTGEILKGHVSLGSLRVRQDFLIAQGLIGPYKSGQEPSPLMLEMALARLRQLSAHEVGHTIGLMHNFAASVNNRASVMDYPHPYIQLGDDGKLDFSKAYDVGIGEWDKRTIIYGYSDFPDGTDEAEALRAIIQKNIMDDFHYITDQDARPQGGAHPYAHLWDNGADAVEELNRMMELRDYALNHFDERMIPEGTPLAMLEDVLVPVYFAHRYQAEAAVKLIGGVYYTYTNRGDQQIITQRIAPDRQKAALEAILNTLNPNQLVIPKLVQDMIPPRPPGYRRGREHFKIQTGFTLDPLAAAQASIDHSLGMLFHPQRAARLVEFSALDENQLSLDVLLGKVIESAWGNRETLPYIAELQRLVQKRILHHIIQLALNGESTEQVKAILRFRMESLKGELKSDLSISAQPNVHKAHLQYCIDLIDQYFERPESVKIPKTQQMPDGSPIGCNGIH